MENRAGRQEHSGQAPPSPFATASAFFTAIRFLTVIPVGWRAEQDGELFPTSIFYFPLVGLAIGGGAAILARLTALVLPVQVVAFLVVLYLAAISGFLHLDGLADSGDGLLSARPREQSLAIMKDSRSGAMGVVTLILVLLGKYAALSSLSPATMTGAVLLMPVAGRCAILLAMAIERYARPEGGIGGLFYSRNTRWAAVLGGGVLACASAAVVGGRGMLLICVVTLLTVVAFCRFCRARIGGATGDTLGATCELIELATAIALAGFFQHG